jgi:hypothetical protein
MATASTSRDYRTRIAAASLVGGPLLMAVGDLMHPPESMAPREQIALIVHDASRWYTAHLLLFVGLMVFIPGLLALTALARARRPVSGYAASILVMVGAAATTSVFVAEMLVGRFLLDGAEPAVATDLLESMFSVPIVAAVGPAMLAFFVGTAVFATPLMRGRDRVGLAAATILLGALLILAEIFSAQVVLSQVGNILVLCGSAAFAWLILQGAAGEVAEPM